MRRQNVYSCSHVISVNFPVCYQAYGLRQIRDPELPSAAELPTSYRSPIAIVGAGPAGLSAATYLARLGYTDVTIFEAAAVPGGISTLEIPQHRLPQQAVDFEIKLVRDLGVKFQFNQRLGRDFTVQSLKEKGFAAVFVGVGKSSAMKDDVFEGLTTADGYYTSKEFLPAVSCVTKKCHHACKDSKCECLSLPQLKGRVIVLGAGDVAMDCATTAFRCGADRVVVMFRRDTTGIRVCSPVATCCLQLHSDSGFTHCCCCFR